MNIKDRGIILSIKKYSESSLILKILSENNGIYSGFIRGALGSKKNRSLYQIGNLVEFNWQAKNEENLGFFKIELIKSHLADILLDQIKLNAVTTIIGIICQTVFERQHDENLFNKLLNLLSGLNDFVEIFLSNYIKLEIELLQSLGYGIDLSKCAATGSLEDLQFVSPKSGKAVCGSAGEKYADRLLKLPKFLIENNSKKINKNDLLNGLKLSGFFIEKYLSEPGNVNIPSSRNRLVNLVKDNLSLV